MFAVERTANIKDNPLETGPIFLEAAWFRTRYLFLKGAVVFPFLSSQQKGKRKNSALRSQRLSGKKTQNIRANTSQ